MFLIRKTRLSLLRLGYTHHPLPRASWNAIWYQPGWSKRAEWLQVFVSLPEQIHKRHCVHYSYRDISSQSTSFLCSFSFSIQTRTVSSIWRLPLFYISWRLAFGEYWLFRVQVPLSVSTQVPVIKHFLILLRAKMRRRSMLPRNFMFSRIPIDIRPQNSHLWLLTKTWACYATRYYRCRAQLLPSQDRVSHWHTHLLQSSRWNMLLCQGLCIGKVCGWLPLRDRSQNWMFSLRQRAYYATRYHCSSAQLFTYQDQVSNRHPYLLQSSRWYMLLC